MKKIKISSKVKIIRGNLFQKNNSSKVRAGNLIKGKINLKKNTGKNLLIWITSYISIKFLINNYGDSSQVIHDSFYIPVYINLITI